MESERECWKTGQRCLKEKNTWPEYKAMHEKNFLRSWLRDDTEDEGGNDDRRREEKEEEAKSVQ